MSQSSELGTCGEPAPRPLDWIGTARYEVLRCIARGAMGSVYEAYDRERRQHVALKRLLYFSPNSLFMFKQEFRTLVDTCHPNLVRLHELVAAEGERIFFSMDLVHGTGLPWLCERAASLDRPRRTVRNDPLVAHGDRRAAAFHATAGFARRDSRSTHAC